MIGPRGFDRCSMLMMSFVVGDLCSDSSVFKSSLPNTVSVLHVNQDPQSFIRVVCMYVSVWFRFTGVFPTRWMREWDCWQGGKSTLSLSRKTNKATLAICPTSGVSNWRGRGQPSAEEGRNLRKLSRYLKISTRLIHMYTHWISRRF